MNNLIVYASKYGSTEKCSEELSKHLPGKTEMITPEVGSIKKIDSYDRIIIGTPIYVGKFHERVVSFLDNHEPELSEKGFDFLYSPVGRLMSI